MGTLTYTAVSLLESIVLVLPNVVILKFLIVYVLPSLIWEAKLSNITNLNTFVPSHTAALVLLWTALGLALPSEKCQPVTLGVSLRYTTFTVRGGSLLYGSLVLR